MIKIEFDGKLYSLRKDDNYCSPKYISFNIFEKSTEFALGYVEIDIEYLKDLLDEI